MEWSMFFSIYGNSPLEKSNVSIEELYLQFENRFVSTNVVKSPELLEPAEIEPID